MIENKYKYTDTEITQEEKDIVNIVCDRREKMKNARLNS
jgi:hypothetical protein